jgi:hypothetical protein
MRVPVLLGPEKPEPTRTHWKPCVTRGHPPPEGTDVAGNASRSSTGRKRWRGGTAQTPRCLHPESTYRPSGWEHHERLRERLGAVTERLGDAFHTKTGTPFSFDATSSSVALRNIERSMPGGPFKKALDRFPVFRSGDLHFPQGPSYLLVILTDPGWGSPTCRDSRRSRPAVQSDDATAEQIRCRPLPRPVSHWVPVPMPRTDSAMCRPPAHRQTVDTPRHERAVHWARCSAPRRWFW